MTRIVIFFLLFFVCFPASAVTDRYDLTIKKWASYYTPIIDWKLLKAQFMAESNLRPKARSPVGARGIAQIMPGTWREISRQLGKKGNVYDPDLNIQFGAYYMGRMLKGWNIKGRTVESRIKLAQASYNAGIGNLYKAQKRSGGKMSYDGIISALPRVTGHHSKETIGYVKRIWRFWRELKLM